MVDRATVDVILLNDIMDLYMPSRNTLVPEGPCCVFYATRFQVYWRLTINVVFCYYPDLISQRQTAPTGPNRLAHPYINIY